MFINTLFLAQASIRNEMIMANHGSLSFYVLWWEEWNRITPYHRCLSSARGDLDYPFYVLLLACPFFDWRSFVCYVFVLFLAWHSLVREGLHLTELLWSRRFSISHSALSHFGRSFLIYLCHHSLGLRAQEFLKNLCFLISLHFFLSKVSSKSEVWWALDQSSFRYRMSAPGVRFWEFHQSRCYCFHLPWLSCFKFFPKNQAR